MGIFENFSEQEQPKKEYEEKLEGESIGDWSESVLGEFDDEELKRIRNDHPKELAKYYNKV